jgi:hypothetical protein
MPGRVPLLDDHAHPFPLTATELDLAELSLSIDPSASDDRRSAAPHRLALEMLRCRLAGVLGCTPDDVLTARAEAARDWAGWVRRLFDDAVIGGMLLDGGPSPLGTDDLRKHAAVAGRPMWSLYRIEALIDPLLEDGADGPTIERALEDAVSAAARDGAAGLKSVIAYRTGLAVDPAVSVDDAYRSAESDLPVRRRAKALRDRLLLRTFAQCADLGLPIQIHTGFGDSDIRLGTADPLLLDDVLRTPEGEAARVVLIHAGYPWHEKLAYLALARRNLYAEMSLVNLFSPATTADRLLRLLDLAPVNRILFGTDGHGSPETHWFAATVLRSAWQHVRAALREQVRESWLDTVEERLFRDNALDVYGLRPDADGVR